MATTVTPGAGAGTSATATLINGDDGHGIIEIVTGISPTPGGVICSLAFDQPYSVNSRVTILSANNSAAMFISSIIQSAEADTDGFDMGGSSTALTLGLTLRYAYVVEPNF